MNYKTTMEMLDAANNYVTETGLTYFDYTKTASVRLSLEIKRAGNNPHQTEAIANRTIQKSLTLSGKLQI